MFGDSLLKTESTGFEIKDLGLNIRPTSSLLYFLSK